MQGKTLKKTMENFATFCLNVFVNYYFIDTVIALIK